MFFIVNIRVLVKIILTVIHIFLVNAPHVLLPPGEDIPIVKDYDFCKLLMIGYCGRLSAEVTECAKHVITYYDNDDVDVFPANQYHAEFNGYLIAEDIQTPSAFCEGHALENECLDSLAEFSRRGIRPVYYAFYQTKLTNYSPLLGHYFQILYMNHIIDMVTVDERSVRRPAKFCRDLYPETSSIQKTSRLQK